jgi:NAD(P)-dependent dehydrogenase (short-subunit alcohol dehydrogenase family)
MSCFAALSVGSAIGSICNVDAAALTKNLADELAPSGISVVCAHPSRTRTERTAEFVDKRRCTASPVNSFPLSFLVERTQLESIQTTNAHRSCGVLVSILRPRLR